MEAELALGEDHEPTRIVMDRLSHRPSLRNGERICGAVPSTMRRASMVLYAVDESFSFATPEGHTLSAWITLSAEGVTARSTPSWSGPGRMASRRPEEACRLLSGVGPREAAAVIHVTC
jgi:hypothetical protein